MDVAVREAAIEYFERKFEDGRVPKFEYDDIWGLELTDNVSDECLVTVAGMIQVPSRYGLATYEFWACVNKDTKDGYTAEIVDEEMVGD